MRRDAPAADGSVAYTNAASNEFASADAARHANRSRIREYGCGRRALPDVPLDLSVEYQSWPPSLTTDANGRYTWLGNGSGLKVVAQKAGYSQPCRVSLRPTTADQDLYVVANETLATSGVPASMPIVGPVLTGRVFERTSNGERPVSGATVILDFTGGMGWARSATTITDAAGRYLLCNVEDVGFGFYAFVSKPGYTEAFVHVNVKPLATFDIELRR
jgi:hypothetical protein